MWPARIHRGAGDNGPWTERVSAGSLRVEAATCRGARGAWRVVDPCTATPSHYNLDGSLLPEAGAAGHGLDIVDAFAPTAAEPFGGLVVQAFECREKKEFNWQAALAGLPIPGAAVPIKIAQWLVVLHLDQKYAGDKSECVAKGGRVRVAFEVDGDGAFSLRGGGDTRDWSHDGFAGEDADAETRSWYEVRMRDVVTLGAAPMPPAGSGTLLTSALCACEFKFVLGQSQRSMMLCARWAGSRIVLMLFPCAPVPVAAVSASTPRVPVQCQTCPTHLTTAPDTRLPDHLTNPAAGEKEESPNARGGPDAEHIGTSCDGTGTCKWADGCGEPDSQLDGACPGSEEVKCCVPAASGALQPRGRALGFSQVLCE